MTFVNAVYYGPDARRVVCGVIIKEADSIEEMRSRLSAHCRTFQQRADVLMNEAGWPPDVAPPPFAPFLVITRAIQLVQPKDLKARV